ncbi:MAG: dienelactone hydrolase, partial [Polaromonas sp.]
MLDVVKPAEMPSMLMPKTTHLRLMLFQWALCQVLALMPTLATAAVGLTEIPGDADGGPVTVFYASGDAPRPVQRGSFMLDVAVDGAPQVGNRRLVVISHGSPASPWVYADLARVLVGAGF